MRCLLSAILLTLTFAICPAEPTRTWMSADGKKTFRGRYVERDRNTVTFRISPSDHKATLPLSMIHPEDIKWLDLNHPLPGVSRQSVSSGNTAPTISAGPRVFGDIALGDSYGVVSRKLAANKNLKLNIPASMLGRTGLNGAYQTIQPMAGTTATLFFDWTSSRQLKELTLHGSPQPRSMATAKVLAAREAMAAQLIKVYGKPQRANPKLDVLAIPEGGILFSHVWTLEKQGYALLGASCTEGQYQLTLRFTTEPH